MKTYLWIAIDLDEELSQIKSKCIEIEKSLNFKNSCHDLPMHVSLKISFPVENEKLEDAIDSLSNYLKSLSPFTVTPQKIELVNNVVWIKMNDSQTLSKIHLDIDELLLQRFNVNRHQFDLDFIFHSTLFFGGESQLINNAFELVKNLTLPGELTVNKFVFGTSKSGEPFTYEVIKRFGV